MFLAFGIDRKLRGNRAIWMPHWIICECCRKIIRTAAVPGINSSNAAAENTGLARQS